MKGDTTHIRVRLATRQRLLDLIASLLTQSERGRVPQLVINPDNNNPAALGVSMDAAINFLLDTRVKHRKRADKSAAKKKAAKATRPATAKKPSEN